jgi:hypothetical protein
MHLTPSKVGLVLVLLSGLLHGWWTQRWQESRALEDAVIRLDDVPMTVGAWRGNDEALDAEQVSHAGLAGGWMRRYVQPQTGTTLTVLLLCGQPGPTAVHTPEWCYRGVGYLPDRPERQTLPLPPDQPPAECWVGQFRKQDGVVWAGLRIHWSWSSTGAWRAPDYPRLAFARYPVLFKLYVVRELSLPGETADEDPVTGFLEDFLPQLNACLFPTPP